MDAKGGWKEVHKRGGIHRRKQTALHRKAQQNRNVKGLLRDFAAATIP